MTLRPLVALFVVCAASGCDGCNKAPSAAPPSAADAASDASARPLPYLPARSAPDAPAPPSKVEPVLFSLRPGFNFCYRAAAHERPELEGNATFSVAIGSDGHVTGVTLTTPESTLGLTLLSCVENVIRGALFEPPPDGGVASIMVPIAFRPPPRTADGGR